MNDIEAWNRITELEAELGVWKVQAMNEAERAQARITELDEQARNWRAVQRAYPQLAQHMLERARERGFE